MWNPWIQRADCKTQELGVLAQQTAENHVLISDFSLSIVFQSLQSTFLYMSRDFHIFSDHPVLKP